MTIEYVQSGPRWWRLSTDDMSERTEGYYFWDEVGTACCGPYPTEYKARLHMAMYADVLDQCRESPPP